MYVLTTVCAAFMFCTAATFIVSVSALVLVIQEKQQRRAKAYREDAHA